MGFFFLHVSDVAHWPLVIVFIEQVLLHIFSCLNLLGRRYMAEILPIRVKLYPINQPIKSCSSTQILSIFQHALQKVRDSVTIDTWPDVFIFLESLLFYSIVTSIFFVFSCYINFIAHVFHINGVHNKTRGRGSLINSLSQRHLTPPYIYSHGNQA